MGDYSIRNLAEYLAKATHSRVTHLSDSEFYLEGGRADIMYKDHLRSKYAGGDGTSGGTISAAQSIRMHSPDKTWYSRAKPQTNTRARIEQDQFHLSCHYLVDVPRGALQRGGDFAWQVIVRGVLEAESKVAECINAHVELDAYREYKERKARKVGRP